MTHKNPGTFSHSVKVPRLYKVCSSILQQFEAKRGSLKTLVYAARKKHPNIKALMSLASTVIDNKSALDEMICESKILVKEAPLQEPLAKVLIAELIWGKGTLPGDSKPVLAVTKYQEVFSRHKDTVKKNARAVNPRWVRVNTLKVLSVDWLHSALKKEGFKRQLYDKCISYDDYLDLVKSLGKGSYVEDYHLPGVLAFASGTEFHQSRLYKEGCLVLQDKASCLTVAALDLTRGCSVLDACSAPGMKTIQAAAAVTKSGKVTAIERDQKRCSTLRATVKKHAGGQDSFVKVLHKDFLTVDPNEYPGVEAIVLDPSCSGSGIRDTGVTDLSSQRLEKLAEMQAKLLTHALTFPGLKALAYSTCSTQRIENEDVVTKVLKQHQNQFRLRKGVLPRWGRRGDQDSELAERFIRADPDKDLCHGFFVAVIEKCHV